MKGDVFAIHYAIREYAIISAEIEVEGSRREEGKNPFRAYLYRVFVLLIMLLFSCRFEKSKKKGALISDRARKARGKGVGNALF